MNLYLNAIFNKVVVELKRTILQLNTNIILAIFCTRRYSIVAIYYNINCDYKDIINCI